MLHSSAWSLFTRIGEAQLLLPAMAAAWFWLVCSRRTWPLAAAWALAGFVAALVTTASKVAFIGYGVGWAALDFTGFSGHSMFAALILPVLARIAVGDASPRRARWAVVFGYALAAAVAWSRIVTGAHSPSEAISGFFLGGLASALALRAPSAGAAAVPPWLLAALLAWLLVLPFGAPPSRTHGWVTALSLQISGRPTPYTRRAMHREAEQEQRRNSSSEARLALDSEA